jgi:hypothetical protein
MGSVIYVQITTVLWIDENIISISYEICVMFNDVGQTEMLTSDQLHLFTPLVLVLRPKLLLKDKKVLITRQ